jgi:hypothetical protein
MPVIIGGSPRDVDYEAGIMASLQYDDGRIHDRTIMVTYQQWSAAARSALLDPDTFEYCWGFMDGLTNIMAKRSNNPYSQFKPVWKQL